MNAKKCKQLRRRAEAVTVGMPARRLVVWNQHTVRDGANTSGAAINDPSTTRGVYRHMKKNAQ